MTVDRDLEPEIGNMQMDPQKAQRHTVLVRLLVYGYFRAIILSAIVFAMLYVFMKVRVGESAFFATLALMVQLPGLIAMTRRLVSTPESAETSGEHKAPAQDWGLGKSFLVGWLFTAGIVICGLYAYRAFAAGGHLVAGLLSVAAAVTLVVLKAAVVKRPPLFKPKEGGAGATRGQ